VQKYKKKRGCHKNLSFRFSALLPLDHNRESVENQASLRNGAVPVFNVQNKTVNLEKQINNSGFVVKEQARRDFAFGELLRSSGLLYFLTQYQLSVC